VLWAGAQEWSPCREGLPRLVWHQERGRGRHCGVALDAKGHWEGLGE